MTVTVVDHPLVQHKLTIMRDKETSTAGFRRLLREISLLLGYEVTRDLELTTKSIETPIETMEAPTLEGKKLVFASVLRAGNGLLEGLLDLVPAARVAHVGLYRDHETLEAVEYFFRRRATSPIAWSSSSTRCWQLPIRRSRPSTSSRAVAPPTYASCACSPRPRASSASPRRIPTYLCLPPRSTAR